MKWKEAKAAAAKEKNHFLSYFFVQNFPHSLFLSFLLLSSVHIYKASAAQTVTQNVHLLNFYVSYRVCECVKVRSCDIKF